MARFLIAGISDGTVAILEIFEIYMSFSKSLKDWILISTDCKNCLPISVVCKRGRI